MKLWLLRPSKDRPRDSWEWESQYDNACGFVVCAATEEQARQIADKNSGDETSERERPWLDPAMTSCTPLRAGSKAALIIRDYRSG